MQRKNWIMAMVLCCQAVSAAAENVPPGPPPAPPVKDFAAVKQQMLSRIDQRLLKLHAEQDGVKAATTHEELSACRPKKRAQRGQKQPVGAQPSPALPVIPPPA